MAGQYRMEQEELKKQRLDPMTDPSYYDNNPMQRDSSIGLNKANAMMQGAYGQDETGAYTVPLPAEQQTMSGRRVADPTNPAMAGKQPSSFSAIIDYLRNLRTTAGR